MTNLTLKNGRTYLTRHGEKVVIFEMTYGSTRPFGGSNGFYYHENGRALDLGFHVLDLVEEADLEQPGVRGADGIEAPSAPPRLYTLETILENLKTKFS